MKITYNYLRRFMICKEAKLSFINYLNGTEYTEETLPKDLSGHRLETPEFEYNLEMQLIFIQTKGIKEWIGWLWYYEILPDISMQGVNLMGANLKGANLAGANLKGVNLGEANLKGANLGDANLKGANLGDAKLKKVNFRWADLEGANLGEANLKGAYLGGANLKKVNFRWADLEGANLEWANLKGAYLIRVNLEGAKYNKYTEFPDGFDPEKVGMIYIEDEDE